MKKAYLILSLSAVLLSVAMPVQATEDYKVGDETNYDDSYVPCGTHTNIKGEIDNPCQFKDVIILAKRLMFGWIMAGVTFATLGFAYAGYLYITAMGSAESISHAHSIFTKTFLGFVFMLSAWLIVYTIEGVFLRKNIRDNSFLSPGKP